MKTDFLRRNDFMTCASEIAGNYDNISTKSALQHYAGDMILEGQYFVARHIINALDKDDAQFYNYSYDMGTLETPTPCRGKVDLLDLDIWENDTAEFLDQYYCINYPTRNLYLSKDWGARFDEYRALCRKAFSKALRYLTAEHGRNKLDEISAYTSSSAFAGLFVCNECLRVIGKPSRVLRCLAVDDISLEEPFVVMIYDNYDQDGNELQQTYCAKCLL